MYMHIYKHYMYVQLRTEWTDFFLYYRWNIETCYLITLKLNGFFNTWQFGCLWIPGINRMRDNREISHGTNLYPSWLSVIMFGKANSGGFCIDLTIPDTRSYQLHRPASRDGTCGFQSYYGAAAWVTIYVISSANPLFKRLVTGAHFTNMGLHCSYNE